MKEQMMTKIDCSKMKNAGDCLKNKCEYAFALEGDFFCSKLKTKVVFKKKLDATEQPPEEMVYSIHQSK